MQPVTVLLVVAMILFLSHQSPVHAYLDPGTGSIVLQAVMAGVVGALAVVRLYWSRIKRLVGRHDPNDKIHG
jgi:hypothetical protein